MRIELSIPFRLSEALTHLHTVAIPEKLPDVEITAITTDTRCAKENDNMQ